MRKRHLLLALAATITLAQPVEAKIGFRQYNTPFGNQNATNWITPNAANHLITSTDGQQWVSASVSSIISGGLDPTLQALEGLNGTPGLVTQTGVDTFTKRTLVSSDNSVDITNPAGTAGNPDLIVSNHSASLLTSGTVANARLDTTLQAFAALDGTPGFVVVTGVDTLTRRSFAVGSGKLTVTNPAGTAGNVTYDLGVVAESDITDLVSDLAGKQPLDSDLTTLSSLSGALKGVRRNAADNNYELYTTPISISAVSGQWLDSFDATTGMFTQSQPDYTDLTGTPQLPITKAAVASNWLRSYDSVTGLFTASQPVESDIVNLVSDLAGKQPLDADLTTLASLSGASKVVARKSDDSGYELITASTGSVTSIGVNAPSTIFTSSADITTSGDVTLSYATGQTANRIFGTNSSGDVGLMAMTTNQLVSHTHAQSDITNLVTDLSNKQPLDTLLTAISGLSGTALQYLRRNAANNAYEFGALPASGGTVTSIGVNAPSTIFTSSADITTSGDVTLSYATGQTANRVIGTNGSGTVSLLALTLSHLPSLASTNLSDTSTIARTNANNNFTASQLPNAVSSYDLGSTTKWWSKIYFGDDATNYGVFDAQPLTGNRTYNAPDADATLVQASSAVATQYMTGINATTGAITRAQPSFSDISGTLSSSQVPTQTKFFGGDGSRTLPTSGSISGVYMHSGNWTSTNTITAASGTKIYVTGTFTLSHAMTVSPQIGGGGSGINTTSIDGGIGCGLAGGRGGTGSRGGGSGGGHVGAGGSGGVGAGNRAGAQGTITSSPHVDFLKGSGGGGGAYNSTDSQTGGGGGQGGGDIYIEVLGAVTIGANISALGGNGSDGNGTATQRGGAGGGGSGGMVEIRTRGNYTQNSSCVINVSGGNGGAGGSTRGAGGGGGGAGNIQVLAGGTYTQNGSFTTSGGTAGSSGEATAASAGGSGNSSGTGSLTSVPPRW